MFFFSSLTKLTIKELPYYGKWFNPSFLYVLHLVLHNDNSIYSPEIKAQSDLTMALQKIIAFSLLIGAVSSKTIDRCTFIDELEKVSDLIGYKEYTAGDCK